MPNKQLDLVIPVDKGFSELLASFQNNFYVNVLPETVDYRVFYDTFDWRLYNHGAMLEMHEEGPSTRIYWRTDKDSDLKIQLGLKQIPQLASDLPKCEFRNQLKSVIAVRELMPRIKIKIKRQPLVVLDNHDKVVVRINFDEHWYFPSKIRAGTVLGKRITIKPVKGYADEFGQVIAFFQPMELRDAQDNMMKLALAESGLSTSEYTTKLNLFLDPDMSAELALKEILLRLLEIMQQNTAGCIRGRDTEFMHDYRVTIRKTRSALSQISKVLPQGVIAKYNKFFSQLGKLTNPVRDLDVLLLKLESYKRNLQKPEQFQLRSLQQYIAHSREVAQKKFVKTVKSAEYRQNIKQWRDYLETTDPTSPPLENSGKAVSILADELIWNMYQLALQEGGTITNESAAEAVHELRKTCKKLRYLMEFFQSLYPARRIREILRALKELQDNLGEFNDLHVHANIIKQFTEASAEIDVNDACQQIMHFIEHRQAKIRNRFAECFALFSSAENQAEFKDLLVEARKGQA